MTADPAATVIVLRQAPAGPQVLLLRRHPRLSFMGDYWSFPGGRMDPEDLAGPVARRIEAGMPDLVRTVRDCPVLPVPADAARGLVAAAIRELHEETGLSLAWPAGGPGPHHGAAAGMIYWARWITPSRLERRFDTHFFAACVAADAPLRRAEAEFTAARWMSPAEAIAAGESGGMLLATPTLIVLRDMDRALSGGRSVADMLDRERGRPVLPVLMKLIGSGSDEVSVLPWDPDYEACAGEGVAIATLIPGYWREWPVK